MSRSSRLGIIAWLGIAGWLGGMGAAVGTAQSEPAATPLPSQPNLLSQQNGPSPQNESQKNLAALQQNVAKTTAEWNVLASGLEARIFRLLPCDPRIRTAIEEVSRASEARLNALSQYVQAAAMDARQQTDVAKRLLAEQDAFAAEWNTERTEAQQEGAGIDAQGEDIAESAKRRPALSDAQKTLAGIAATAGQRAAQAEDHVNRAAALSDLLRNLLAADQGQQAAFDAEIRALTQERARWSAYYGARLGRAQTECTITNPGAAAPARGAQGKKP